ncbi:hypothetical protein FJT64_026508 [Amphibalanus amphitrite]|uniref:Uncharacterized protein n=1 Tax=Amphibalanus amphitrite TaxID=1232801 RepID=A0A6A4W1L4_AMPAM|nr:hypothetical protein FJT64_026508 [Amphibalanus amphitrite]
MAVGAPHQGRAVLGLRHIRVCRPQRAGLPASADRAGPSQCTGPSAGSEGGQRVTRLGHRGLGSRLRRRPSSGLPATILSHVGQETSKLCQGAASECHDLHCGQAGP